MKKNIISGGGDSFVEAMMNRAKEDNKIIKEKQDKENESFQGAASGQIVLSTAVNSKRLSDNVVKNKLLQVFSTVRNRMFSKRLLNKVLDKHNSYAWKTDRHVTGTYTGKDNRTYSENLIAIYCTDIPKEPLFRVAEELMAVFKQVAVLVKYNNQVHFLERSSGLK